MAIDLTDPARERLANLQHFGELTEEQVAGMNLRLIQADHGGSSGDHQVTLYLAVDDDGTIQDARFRSMATGPALVGWDILTSMLPGRDVGEISEILPSEVAALASASLGLDLRELYPDPDQPYYVLVKASKRYFGIAEPEAESATPAAAAEPAASDWNACGLFEKVRRIEAVLDEHVRPALASDGGGLDLIDLRDDELIVQYNGACGSCGSAIGGTLMFIQDTLNTALGTELTVTPQGLQDENPFWY